MAAIKDNNSIMWPSMEDKMKLTGEDSKFFLIFVTTANYLLQTNNKRHHVIVAWCYLVINSLFDPEELKKFLNYDNLNDLPWFSADIAERSKWIPMAIVLFKEYSEEDLCMRYKHYILYFFRQLYRDPNFKPVRIIGKQAYLVAKTVDVTVSQSFGLIKTPSLTVEITGDQYDRLNEIGYPGLFIDKINTRDGAHTYYAFGGSSTLAITRNPKSPHNSIIKNVG